MLAVRVAARTATVRAKAIFVLPSIQSWAQAHRSQKAESDSVSVGSESSGENSDSVSESKEEEL